MKYKIIKSEITWSCIKDESMEGIEGNKGREREKRDCELVWIVDGWI